ncbi:MAG: PAS domain-containing protein [Alphaproteobacteria bacterium]|nr:PAS domain-containing protein [Alphaproteobacteria bacterium]
MALRDERVDLAGLGRHARALMASARIRDLFWSALGVTAMHVVLAALGFISLLGATIAGFAALAIFLAVAIVRGAANAADAASSERRRASEGADAEDGLLPGTAAESLDRLPDPLLVVDSAGRIVLANRASMRALGGPSLRRHISGVIRNPSVLEAVTRVLEGGPAETVEYSFLVPLERHFQADIFPVPGSRKGEIWAIVLMHDLTAMRRVDQMRADFVANASHELRTPLASVAGYIETLRGHARNDPEAQERFLEIMHEQTKRMRRLIDDLLSLSRIELNEHVPPGGEVDVETVLRDVIDALTPVAATRKIRVRLVVADNLPLVKGERDELVQVFQNLIDNAIKYGASGGDVTVTCDRAAPPGGNAKNQMIIFVAVKDNGPGIAREHLPRLTERFYRVDAKMSRERGGTGLGLAIVKHILVRHQGWLSIESKLEEGSTFTVFLPGLPGTSRSLGAPERQAAKA